MSDNIPQIFNRKLLRDIYNKNSETIFHTDFLCDYAVSLLIEKLSQTKLQFSQILNLGLVSKQLQDFLNNKYVNSDIIYAHHSLNYLKQICANQKIVLDEELIPISENNFDLIISVLNLHYINDLPGTLIQIKRLLKDKGLFLAVFLGEETLRELRYACLETDSKLGNASPKVPPFLDVKTTGLLLKRTNFHMPVVDNQKLTIEYHDINKLLQDIKDMGGANILYQKSNSLMGKNRLNMIKNNYLKKFRNNSIIVANFELINVTAFKN